MLMRKYGTEVKREQDNIREMKKQARKNKRKK